MTREANRLLDFWKQVLPVHDDVYFQGAIPEAQLRKVCSIYSLPDPEGVLLVYDDTLFGGGGDGFVLTASHFGFKSLAFGPQLVAFSDLTPGDIQYDGRQVTVRGEQVEITGEVAALKAGVGRALRQTLQGYRAAGPAGPYRDTPSLVGPHAILEILRATLPKHDDLYYRGEIPSRKLNNVVKQYAIRDPQDVLALYDDTIFGSADEGFVITGAKIYFKDITSGPVDVEIRLLNEWDIAYEKGALIVKGKKVEIGYDNLRLAEKLGEALRAILSGGAR
jgi:hypothetical protein